MLDVEILETYPPDHRVVFSTREKILGIKHYISYGPGTEAVNVVQRASELSMLMDYHRMGKKFHGKEVTMEVIKYVKQKLDEAFDGL